ncbi:hypothetical protein K435DRAFT_972210 [Dendrothele bispora CBS 962.96]|uniref:Uncharacterized protein n=1 Tax=Dendrothele bispora (strain CBS 962.96) TaxID=1314807 RepID=A0A4S8L0G7_DENBC|nr:hypothetical protein K435DRAFT_972210 [Dendrothele bispora CBS 962.96]
MATSYVNNPVLSPKPQDRDVHVCSNPSAYFDFQVFPTPEIVFAHAPLLNLVSSTHWTPNLISFDAGQIINSYYVQQMFSLNRGDQYIPSTLPSKQELFAGSFRASKLTTSSSSSSGGGTSGGMGTSSGSTGGSSGGVLKHGQCGGTGYTTPGPLLLIRCSLESITKFGYTDFFESFWPWKPDVRRQDHRRTTGHAASKWFLANLYKLYDKDSKMNSEEKHMPRKTIVGGVGIGSVCVPTT